MGDGSFGAHIARAYQSGRLVVQPRMGFAEPETMRAGLLAVRQAQVTTAGTITVDSYTRLGLHDMARRALAAGIPLNGYPLVVHGTATNRAMLDGVQRSDFPVQVRHGSARPLAIVAEMGRAGLHATEGGPVSYCLPYGRVPLRESISDWRRACELLRGIAADGRDGPEPHVETFGGCLMGQLCPPGLLVATSILEACFFRQHGLRSVSLSYTQQTSPAQDQQAIQALTTLARELLPDMDWHIVLYAYMGLFPRTAGGARLLLEEAARLAVQTGAARLIVKTTAEAFRIPTVAENIAALEVAALAADRSRPHEMPRPRAAGDNEVLAEARALVEAVLDLGEDVGDALYTAFLRGYLDAPFCLHPDNRGASRSYIASDGRLRWSRVGAMPIAAPTRADARREMTAADLLASLSYMRDTFDRQAHQASRLFVDHRTGARSS